MKNRYDCSMKIYGNILIGAGKLSKIPILSKEAKRRQKELVRPLSNRFIPVDTKPFFER